jgi:hypothetical protein
MPSEQIHIWSSSLHTWAPYTHTVQRPWIQYITSYGISFKIPGLSVEFTIFYFICVIPTSYICIVRLSPLSPSPPPSEFCNDENNSVTRSALDALRNSKKISLLAVVILFLFTFFNLIVLTHANFSHWIGIGITYLPKHSPTFMHANLTLRNYRVHTKWQRPLFGVHSIMMKRLAQAGMSVGAHAHPLPL